MEQVLPAHVDHERYRHAKGMNVIERGRIQRRKQLDRSEIELELASDMGVDHFGALGFAIHAQFERAQDRRVRALGHLNGIS
jgi:hypothetical protein